MKIIIKIIYTLLWLAFIFSVPLALLPPEIWIFESIINFVVEYKPLFLGIFGMSFIGWFTWVELNVRKNKEAHKVITDLFENHKSAITDLQEKFKSTSTDLKSKEKDIKQLIKLTEQLQKDLIELAAISVKEESKILKTKHALEQRRAELVEKRKLFKEEQRERKEQLRRKNINK